MDKTLLVLGLLHSQPLHGYELHRIVRAHGELYSNLKKANLYYLLERLAADGHLHVETEANARGARGERLRYSLTEQGKQEFERLLRSVLLHYEPVHEGVDVAIMFLSSLPIDEAFALLEERLQSVVQRRDKIAADLGPFAENGVLHAIAADHLIVLMDAEIAWIRRSLQRLHSNSQFGQSSACAHQVSRMDAAAQKKEFADEAHGR